MTSLFTPALAAHVLVAVLGLGSVLSIAIVAALARKRRCVKTRMVKELDLFESNNGCGMNGLSNGPCRRVRQHRWG